MPPPPVLVPIDGVYDGLNRVFYPPTPYAAGSLRVWLNGVLQRQDFDDGWIELSSIAFQMKEAPKVGDTLSVFYTRV